jgi:DNA-binding NarL/FixJ family response regulator
MVPMNDQPSAVRVLLVDDDALVRAGLRMILGADATIDVIGEAANGRDALTEASQVQPDVVLMDIRMPDMDGITATAHLHQLRQAPHVIVLTTFHLDDYVFAALRAGASGFLLKDTAPTDIIHAIHTVAGGEAMLSPAVTRTLIERFTNEPTESRRNNAVEQLTALTDREREVAIEIGHGHSNADIASNLYMSEATVKAHVSRLLTKLHATNRVQVAIVIHDAGLV